MEQLLEFFKDSEGRIAIWQTPNLALITWAVSSVLSRLINEGRQHSLFGFLAFGAILAWSLGEIWSGVSYFRRVLGLIVLVMVIINHFK